MLNSDKRLKSKTKTKKLMHSYRKLHLNQLINLKKKTNIKIQSIQRYKPSKFRHDDIDGLNDKTNMKVKPENIQGLSGHIKGLAVYQFSV